MKFTIAIYSDITFYKIRPMVDDSKSTIAIISRHWSSDLIPR